MSEEQILWLSALLHDIGKLSQRIGGDYRAKHQVFSQAFVSSLGSYLGEEVARKVADLVALHHDTASVRREVLLLQLADRLSAMERERELRERLNSDEAALVSVASRVELKEDKPEERYLPLARLEVREEVIFPTGRSRVEPGAYGRLWEEFKKRVEGLPRYRSPADFVTLYSVVREFGTLVPSATPWERERENRTVPDVSLFDHSRTTCAIAACLEKLQDELPDDVLLEILERLRKDELEHEVLRRPLFLLMRGDISGIQRFLYCITRPGAEAKGTARRLRGRSFYILLVNELVADWLVRKFGLPVTNLLFCGGGRFDILLPFKKEILRELEDIRHDMERWFLEEFYGELGLQMVWVEVSPADFADFGSVYRKVEDELQKAKRTKFRSLISEPDFFSPTPLRGNICNFCQITPLDEPEDEGPCRLCSLHAEIGRRLPKVSFLAYVYGPTEDIGGSERKWVKFPKFGVSVGLLSEEEVKGTVSDVLGRVDEVIVYKLNSTDGYILGNYEKVGFGFKFLGNEAPVARRRERLVPDKEPVESGEVLDFEEISELSEGAKLLGVLKMDVDHLGLIFGIGVEPPTISRLATLSSRLELFFGAWVNEVCRRTSRKRDENLPSDDRRKGLVESMFYVVYSGGDDLMVVGPWDGIIHLAREIYGDFRRYTAHNPNITLSGGSVLVKPQFPVYRFAHIVGEALGRSKQDGRDRITLFGRTVKWSGDGNDLGRLLAFGERMAQYVEENKLPRGFLHFLMELDRRYISEGDLMWVPRFFYVLARRIRKEVIDELDLHRKVAELGENIWIPASYASLRTRR